MRSFNRNLEKIEMQLRILFEDRLENFLTGDKKYPSFINLLIEEMQHNIRYDAQNRPFAPDRYVIHVPQNDMLKWQIHQDILDEIAATLYLSGKAEGYLFSRQPTIDLQADADTENVGVYISIHATTEPYELPETDAMAQANGKLDNSLIPEDAFLIVGGRENFSLKKNMIDIGRHSSNDLVLDDPHISRHHAQLRTIKQHFVIFDVGSTGGIFINGKQISQATLQTGDVIRLGMTNLIYVQTSTITNPTTTLPADQDDYPDGVILE
jgi:hypothetical protein